MVGKEISLADRVYGLSIFGHDYITDEMHKIAVHRNGVASTKRKNFAIWDLIRVRNVYFKKKTDRHK